MRLRSWKERLWQTLAFETGGLILVTPAYAAIFDLSGAASLRLLLALSAAMLIWSPLHNTLFDLTELRRAGRPAWQRPRGLRVIHAISHELSAIAVTLPILVLLAGHGLGAALMVNLGLTASYSAYTISSTGSGTCRAAAAAAWSCEDQCRERRCDGRGDATGRARR